MAEPVAVALAPLMALELTVATQNCNSLNLTTNIRSYELKIAAIKNLDTDIIFLCDTRLVSNKGISGSSRLAASLRDAKGRKYDVFVNSRTNSRGVAILTDTALRVSPQETFTDPEENFIFLKTELKGVPVLLGSIYGPNNTGRDFFRRIEEIIQRNSGCQVIIGGDWNTVWDRGTVDSNVDIFRMQNIPNKCNRDLLRDMATRFSLFDPTRVLYPEDKIFTYAPFGNLRTNRSRLDFFVISGGLLPCLKNCKPATTVAINLFDHKSVTLCLGAAPLQGIAKFPRLRNSNLDNNYLKYSVLLAAYRCYSFGIKTEINNAPLAPGAYIVANIKEQSKIIGNKLLEVSTMLKVVASRDETPMDSMNISALYAEISLAFSDLPPLEQLSLLPKKCDCSVFF